MIAPVQSRLYKLAEEHGGFFTAHQAQLAGFAPAHIVTLAARGQIERRSRGVYRFPHYPRSRHEQFREATLWAQAHHELPYSLISHTSALELYGISDVNPVRVHVTVPTHVRIRRLIPSWLSIHHAALVPSEIAEYDGIPVTAPVQSILDAAAMDIGPAILAQALLDGFKRGFISRREYNSLNRRLTLSAPKAS